MTEEEMIRIRMECVKLVSHYNGGYILWDDVKKLVDYVLTGDLPASKKDADNQAGMLQKAVA